MKSLAKRRPCPEILHPAERQIIRSRNFQHAQRMDADMRRLHREFLLRMKQLSSKARYLGGR